MTDLLRRFAPELDWKQLKTENPYMLFCRLAHMLFNGATESNLSFFLDHVLSYCDKNRVALSDFLEHWKEKRDKLSIAMDESPNSVRILTIHKSKGLEFPVVIHPFADYPDNKGKRTFGWIRIQDERFAPLDRVRLPMTNALEGTPFEEELEMERARSTMDTYNEMYVALTRAKQRLYVHGKIPGKDSKGSRSNTAIKLIRGYLLDTGLIQDNELVYMDGRHQKVQRAPHHQPAQLPLQSVGNPNWQQRLKIARPVADNDIALSELDARQLGIAMHEAMESIITKVDVPKAVQRLLERGTISQTESELIATRIGNLLEKSELRDLYTPNVSVRNEADIQLASGEWIRPDRVVTAGKKAWVIDYKNGEERSEHVRQVQQYKSAVMELGFTDVDGLLVYLESEKVVRI
ncbi:MAG: hypothetical protein EP314_02240 [Bacteroidetes bacterium]|nr:MAG: hypothetical protein EP314_02240 [Bacteroidota bacterium]